MSPMVSAARRVWRQLPFFVWLVALWMLLWGQFTLLANRAWFDTAPFAGYDWIDVDPSEPHAANALALGGTVILPASFPRTRGRIGSQDFRVTTLDISELQKAESGLTCSSLLFEKFN